MECHSIQFTTISINVERGIVKILFKYRYFQDLLIDIDIDIDISLILLIDIDIDIDIFQNHHIDIDIFGIALSISIFSKMTISILISISIFSKSVDISTIDMSYRYIEQGYCQDHHLPPRRHQMEQAYSTRFTIRQLQIQYSGMKHRAPTNQIICDFSVYCR